MISFLEFVFSSFLEELDQVFGILLLLLSGTRSNLYQTAFLKHFQVTKSTIEHKQTVLYFITVAATVTMFTVQGRRNRSGWSGQNRTTFFSSWLGNDRLSSQSHGKDRHADIYSHGRAKAYCKHL